MKSKTNWFKLLYNENINNKDLGGIDIIYKINERDFLNRDLSILNNYILDEKIVPIVKYGQILARVLTKEPSCKIFNLYYSNWILKKHPNI